MWFYINEVGMILSWSKYQIDDYIFIDSYPKDVLLYDNYGKYYYENGCFNENKEFNTWKDIHTLEMVKVD